MRPRRFSAEEISNAIQEAKTSPVKAVCVRRGFSHTTFYTWKRKYKDMNVEEIGRSWMLQEESKSAIPLVQGSLELMVMQALRNKGELRQSEIQQAIKERSGKRFKPSRNSIFTALNQLKKCLMLKKVESDPEAKVEHHQLTPAGNEYLDERIGYWRQALRGMDRFLYGQWGSDHEQEHTHSDLMNIECRPKQGRGWCAEDF